MPTRLPVAGARAVPSVPTALPDRAPEGHATGRLAFFGGLDGLRDRRPSPPISRRCGERTGSSTPSRPSPGPEAVLAYLARYTHRVAIANSRLLALDERGVTFRYKDYRRDGRARYRTMTLASDEFIRRFLLHTLPKGFHRIRHYGLLASAGREANIGRARELIAIPVPSIDPPSQHDEADLTANTDHRPRCPCCGGRMIIVETFERAGAPRAPLSPDVWVRTATP